MAKIDDDHRAFQDKMTREAQAKGIAAVFPGRDQAKLLRLFASRNGTDWQKINRDDATSVGHHSLVAIRFIQFPDDLVAPSGTEVVVYEAKRFVTQYLCDRASLDSLDELSSLPDWYAELGKGVA